MEFYAHTKTRLNGSIAPKTEWEPLFSGDCGTLRGEFCCKCEKLHPDHGHLNKVAYLAGEFAAAMFPHGSPEAQAARQWGRLAGWWHDLGKFAPEWQDYLCSKSDPHADEITGKIDHSTAGAQHAAQINILGHLFAYPIAGHHSGLLDAESNYGCLKARLKKKAIPSYANAPRQIFNQPIPTLPTFLQPDPYSIAFFTRFLFSCLVDADFLATEAFMNPSQHSVRNQAPSDSIQSIADLVNERINLFGNPVAGDTVNFQRRKVVDDCRLKSAEPPGLFTLTVPTGGGKTLSSLLFALLHAARHGQKRIIFVVPFTSIIEQNAQVIRDIVSPLQSETFTPLIEHHSTLSPEKETEQSRLASENWDAPLIITTAVQFYESLHGNKTSRCRKLHNIANSVVILDEAQSLPVDLLAPCLRVLRELTSRYHTSVVLCTATQPAIQYHPQDFPIGLENCHEIISDPNGLFDVLKRVELNIIGKKTDTELARELQAHKQVLCIVNRRSHAYDIFRLLPESEENFHLSALMCPEHRSIILDEVRQRLASGKPVRLISTQLIEAGVDVDFPTVYRSLAGLDSIAQAAGRCNRNGKLPTGHTYIFIPEDQKAEAYFRETAQVANQLIDLHPDLLGQDAISNYFDLYYYQQSSRWDSKNILGPEKFRFNPQDKSFPFHFQFASIAKEFQLIENWQVPIIIPFDEKARKLVEDLRNPAIPLHRKLLRSLQRYTIQISQKLRDQNFRSFETLREGEFHVLISPELNYSQDFGLNFDEDQTNTSFLHVST